MYVRPHLGPHVFGARAIHATYGPSWAKALMCVGQSRSVRGAPEAAEGATSRNPPKTATTNATGLVPASLQRVTLLISNFGHELSSGASKMSIR
jgi:hypothetical protein